MKHAVQVTILGQQYTVRSEASPTEVAQVAAFVNARIAEVASASKVVDTFNTAILTLLNVAGEYMHLRQADQLGQERLRRLVARLDEQAPTSGAD